MVPVELVLNCPSSACPEYHRGEDRQRQHQVAGPQPRVTLIALQIEGACQAQRHDVEDDWESAKLALNQGYPQDASEDRGRPVRAAAEDHALAEGEAWLPQHGFDRPDEGFVHADGLPHPWVLTEHLAYDSLLHSARKKLQEEGQRDANQAAPPEAPRAAICDHEATEEVDGRPRNRWQHEEDKARREGENQNGAEAQIRHERAHP
mmetsp:Transcript_66658/g.168052  ORF Transcript_66658/g.168052 Transcript_66658/m.168052 type:complete len:206 (-) Transcript_66658:195-812(-)